MFRLTHRLSSIFFAALLGIAVLSSNPSRAEEVIHDFLSQIFVRTDGTLEVTEAISVRAEGNQIKRGIYRDFPLLFEGADGRKREVGFKLLSVKRDGKDEPYHTEKNRTYIRIYLGDSEVFLDHGDYQYEITYRTTRQIRFFETHDELYWNVTGNEWPFPIMQASAVVNLPDGVSATDTVFFTGKYGATEKNAKVTSFDGGNILKFQTTQNLSLYEGLTIGVKMPKGTIAAPSDSQKAHWFWLDFRQEIISIAVLLVVGFYYFRAWSRVGRDPPAGIVVPRWDPPDDISPALVNYIDKKGLSGKGWDAISAAVLNLAVGGYVTIENLSDEVRIAVTGKVADKRLPVGEAAILNKVSRYQGILRLSKEQGSRVKTMQQAFTSAMESEHRNKYFKQNGWRVAGGIALSVLGLLTLLIFGGLSEDTIVFTIFSSVFSIVAGVFLFQIGRTWSVGSSLKSRIATIIRVTMFGFFGFVFLMPMLANITNIFSGPVLGIAVAGLFMLNLLFFYLLGAPTQLGREMMDGIEGLKTYLNLAEKDRMNMKEVPEMSPRHYETLLPYAVALGVEKPWSNAFQNWLLAAVAAGAAASTWNPGWYRGDTFQPGGVGKTMGDLSDGMQSGFSDAMPAPKSSSSGFSGGGSSGGGGGGGGGGGW